MYKFYLFLVFKSEIVHLELIAKEYIICMDSMFMLQCLVCQLCLRYDALIIQKFQTQ